MKPRVEPKMTNDRLSVKNSISKIHTSLPILLAQISILQSPSTEQQPIGISKLSLFFCGIISELRNTSSLSTAIAAKNGPVIFGVCIISLSTVIDGVGGTFLPWLVRTSS